MNRLKLLREEKGLYQADVAEYLGISITAIAYYESEKRDIPTKVLKKLSDFYDCSIDYLLAVSDIRGQKKVSFQNDKICIGLYCKDYINISDEQLHIIDEFAKYILKDNLKKT